MLSSFQFFRVLMTLSYSFDKISQLWLRGWRATNGFYVTLRWGGRPFRFANPNLPKINEYSRQWLCENILCDRYWRITAWMKKKVEIPLDKSSHRYLKWIRSERKARSNFNLFWWKKLQSAEVYSFGFGYLVAVRYAKRSPRTYFMQIQLLFFPILVWNHAIWSMHVQYEFRYSGRACEVSECLLCAVKLSKWRLYFITSLLAILCVWVIN